MQELYLEDYDVNLQFPDEMSEDRIMEIIQRDYPEPDEKLVARFENPDTPASSLTREDFSRYKAAKPEIGLSDLPSIAVDAAVMTASRIIENLPSAIATYANVFEPGTSARTFMEGAARGMYDTETLVKMGNNYLRTKLASFGGTSENEMDEEFRRFLGIKELQNVRGAIERGEQGAWNEYAEFAGLDAAKIDLAKVDQKAAEITGEFIDPTLLIPAGKLGGAASRAMARAASKPVRMAGRGAEIAAEYGREAIERGKNVVRGATEAVDEATGGLGNVVVPGGVATAVASGIVGAGTAQTLGAVVAAPTILDVSGGLLKGFGEAMAHTPTRLGGLGRLALHQPDTIAGRMAGRLKFLDTPIEYAGRAAGGAAIGAGFGGAIGLASGGLEGLAAGIGSGGVLGAAGGGLGRAVEGLTGSALRNAQDADFGRWIESKSPEDRARLESLSREDRIARMDAEQILLPVNAEVRHVDPDFVVDEAGNTLGTAAGFYTTEGEKPIIYLNTNADGRTMLHETLHSLAKLDGFDVLVSNIKNTAKRMYSQTELNDFIRQYEEKLTREIPLAGEQIKRFNGSAEAKVDYILEELAAEYFVNFIKGKNSDYIFSGNSFTEGLRGMFARFTKGKLDRVYDTFSSPIFQSRIKQSRQLDGMMKDMVKARRRAGRDVEASFDQPIKTYSDADLSDDQSFNEMVGMGIAKTDNRGRRVMMGDAEQKRVAKERAAAIDKVLSESEGAAPKQERAPKQEDIEVDDKKASKDKKEKPKREEKPKQDRKRKPGLTKQPNGDWEGSSLSDEQFDALMDSPDIPDTVKKALQELQKIATGDQYANWTYAAATMKTKLGKTRYRNLPISNRDGLMYDIIVSPRTGTISGRILDMSLLETKARRLYRESGEMQKLFGSEANMFADLHTYINALTAGEKRTAEVLGSQRKSDFLNKILSIRNVKGNPEIPDVPLTAAQRRKFEGGKDFPWRSFRLDRIVSMRQREGRPIMSFSEAAYQRGQTHFMPDVDQYGYRMAHRAPDGTYGEGSIDKMNTVYPDDIYSSNGARYYGDDDFESRKTIQLFRSLRGKPEAELTIYRAVPKGVSGVINPGDWVTPSRQYAELHAKYFDETGADILEKKVKAKEVYSEGNSIFEFGWNPKAPGDARFSPGTGRSKADQEYLKAAKAKNYDKLNQMVKQAAAAEGYTIGPVYHGTKRQFNQFRSPRDPNNLVYFSFDQQFSKEYARGFGGHRDPDPDVAERIQKVEAVSRKMLEDDLIALSEKYGSIDDVPDSESDAAFKRSHDYERSQLDGMTAIDALSRMGIRVVNAYLKADRVFDPRDGWGEFADIVAKYNRVSNINQMRPRELEMLNEGNYISWEPAPIIDEVFKNYDAIRIQETSGEPSNTIAVRDPERIKSADPITYNDDGSIIPLSERFKDTTDDIRFSPEPDTIPEVRRQMQEPIESGTPMNGVFTLTPDVIARFSPAVNDPGVNLKQLNGKKVFFMFADRMLVGDYVTRSGRVFKLRGGPDHPDLADNQGKIAWAVEGGPIASRLDKAIRMTDGIGIVVLQDELAVASNKDYSEIMMEELRYDLQNNPAIKKDLKKLLGDLSEAIQKTFKTNRLSKEARDKKEAQKAGKKFTAPKPKKWESIEITSLKDLEEIFPTMPFEVRKIMWQKFASKKYKSKYGGIFWQDVAQNISAYRDRDGYRTGDIVKVIQFDKSGPTSIVDPKDMGLPVHPSYRYGVLGKSISNIRGRLSVFDLLRKQLENPVDPVTGEPKPYQRVTKEGDVGKAAFRALSMRSLTAPELQPTITPGILDPRTHKKPVKQKYDSSMGAARVEAMKEARKQANKFSPAGERMGALPTGEGPVLQRVDTPILAGPASNVISIERIRQEISEDKKAFVFENTAVDNGKMVGLRLDIPTYERTMEAGSPVFPISVHEKWAGKAGGKAGKRIGYTNIATVENPVFMINEKAAEGIKGGKQKSTIATVEGSYRKTTRIPDDIESWTQVAMNPRRHSYYYDRKTGQPVVGGDVAISTGNTVFVKNPVFASVDQFRFSPQRSLNNRGGAVYTTAEGHRAVQTSSRAGVRVYGPTGRRIGPVFGSVEEAERFLNR